jgi:hypothetical protein
MRSINADPNSVLGFGLLLKNLNIHLPNGLDPINGIGVGFWKEINGVAYIVENQQIKWIM